MRCCRDGARCGQPLWIRWIRQAGTMMRDKGGESEVRSRESAGRNAGQRAARHVACGLVAALLCSAGFAQELAPVISKPMSRSVDLPAEIWPFLSVSLHAKVPGY